MSPERKEVTLNIDGREVTALEGEMLHDAARKGDVEIPVFCYEPKLGAPVGACRMCLVEIEGIPKLQTSCSTPVRDGMVVHTRTDQVKTAQNAVVEFLLVNHPLDCPVCDKGGECPLQDNTMGWGPGKSRVIDEKRHFEKPIELSPLVAIDRERCILCYRCVRFSQEVSEDAQLQLLDRGDRTYVGTFDDRPYVSPFQGNITDICPVGALTNYTYRFRARPWDIEQAGSVCTLCPSQCNVSFTVRDEKVKRVITRDNEDVDDGWICDRGRYGFEMFNAEERITGPRTKGGGTVSYEDAIAAGGRGSREARRQGRGYRRRRLQRGGLPGAGDPPERPALERDRLAPGGRPRHRHDPRPRPARAPGDRRRHRRGRRDPRAGDRPDAVLADPRPADPQGDPPQRRAPRGRDRAPDGARRWRRGDRPVRAGPGFLLRRRADRGGRRRRGKRGDAAGREPSRRGQGRRRLGRADRRLGGERAARPRRRPEPAGTDGVGLLEVPDTTNARGLREAGVLPDAGPGLDALALHGRGTEEIRQALIDGELKGLVLVGVDPLRDFADTAAWTEALNAAEFVVAFSTFATATAAKADVLFPLETHAEKDGTVTHPDGRLQRVRPAAGRPGDIRPGWQTLAALSLAIGHDTGVTSQPTAFAALTAAVPFYASITDEKIGGRGIRWQETESASSFPGGGTAPQQPPAGLDREPVKDDADPTGAELRGPGADVDSPDTQRVSASGESMPGTGSAGLALGTYRDLWAGPITELNPPLKFLKPSQRLELSPADAARLSLSIGDRVRVSQGSKSVEATVAIKERVPEGVCFLAEGVALGNANSLLNGHQVRVEIEKLSEVPA